MEKLIKDIMQSIKKEDGYTHKKHDVGYMVSLKGYERKVSLEKSANEIEKEIENYIKENTLELLGIWIESGYIYLDQSINIESKNDALQFGKKNEQLAIFDINNMKTINI